LLTNSLFAYGHEYIKKPNFFNFREGDVRHSLANISKAQKFLGYAANDKVENGISKTTEWYRNHLQTVAIANKKK
jgi:UDP-N-acetylglucosamine 4-epimerase